MVDFGGSISDTKIVENNQVSDVQNQVTPPQVTPPLPPQPPLYKRPIFFVIGAVLLVIILLGTFFLLSQRQKTPPTSQISPTKGPTEPKKTTKKTEAPKLQIQTYIYDGPNASPTSNVQAYSLKDSFQASEVSPIATKLGVGGKVENSNPFVVYSGQSSDNTLVFNKTTGAFLAGYPKGRVATTSTQSLTEKALSELQNIGVADSSVSCNVTYQNKNVPDTTFVECHRDWSRLGLPLVNLPGVLNMNETTLLSNVVPGQTAVLSPLSPNIYNVSNGGDGRARPNDFNTATVGIKNDGTISFIASNLRWITNTLASYAPDDLLTSEQAISLASKGKATISLSVPSGQGNPDWSKVYPNNVGRAYDATISEIIIVYLEDSSQTSQTSYTPYYLIRGIARLESGYAVKYVQALPAQKAKYASSEIPSQTAAISQVNDTKEKTLQMSALTPPPVPQYTEPNTPPTVPTGQGVCTSEGLKQNPGEKQNARKREGGYPSTLFVPGYGNIAIQLYDLPVGAFIIVGLDDNKPIKTQIVREIFRELHIESLGIPIVTDTTTDTCIISGYSPSIFLYPESTSNISVKLGSPVTYLDPPSSNNTWNVTARPDGTLTGQSFTSRLSLYYEFDKEKIRFEQPNRGFVVKRNKTNEAVKNIASKLGFNEKETDSLITDVRNVASELNSNYIRIGLIEQNILDRYLPVQIRPAPQSLKRVHLVISAADGNEQINQPDLKLVIRGGFTVVEIGASLAN